MLAHGAGSGPWVFDGWADSFPGVAVVAVDLQAGLDVGHASMLNYAAVLYRTAELFPPPRALCGWSMGGLAAMMAAGPAGAARLAVLEPSPPAEIQGHDPRVELQEGMYDGPAVYGAFPDGIGARPESSLARAERRRGIDVPALPCPGLVVYGDEFPDDRGRAIASHYGFDECHVEGTDHWGLVLHPEARDAVRGFVTAAV